jgi:hypothetical protein
MAILENMRQMLDRDEVEEFIYLELEELGIQTYRD